MDLIPTGDLSRMFRNELRPILLNVRSLNFPLSLFESYYNQIVSYKYHLSFSVLPTHDCRESFSQYSVLVPLPKISIPQKHTRHSSTLPFSLNRSWIPLTPSFTHETEPSNEHRCLDVLDRIFTIDAIFCLLPALLPPVMYLCKYTNFCAIHPNLPVPDYLTNPPSP